MKHTTIDIHEIIIRYLDGSASIDEKQLLLQWLKESEHNRNDFNETRDLWLSCDATAEDEKETDMALQRLHQRIIGEYNTMKQRRRPLMNWYQTAAVLLVMLSLGGYWLTTRPSAGTETVRVQNQLITAKGSKGRFELPDGTIVWLNSESKLVYPETFDKGRREVALTGEGYFQVVEDKKNPFVVKTDDVDVEVLGTAFDISNYPFMDKAEVVLLNGRVNVHTGNTANPVKLEPGQLYTYNKQSGSKSVRLTKADLHIDWIKERLVFDNQCLSDIIISLEGWYNVEITCPKAFADKTRLSFVVRGENTEEIFSAMKLIIPIDYTISDNKITIRPQ